MKKLLIIPALAFGLTACSPTSNQTLVTLISDAQAAAVTACKFEPTAATIAAILTANQSATAAQIAGLVCGAVNGTTGAPTAGPLFVKVNGQIVPVSGNFVR